ncbi:MAG: alpha-L-arabinofuranosidase C-terminal domain-containing protein [Chryseolinea sp.]
MLPRILIVFVICTATIGIFAQPMTLTINTDQIKSDVQPTMWGIFFEDINFAADGGLYAELIKNRSFEFSKPLMGWKEFGADPYATTSKAGTTNIISGGDDSNPRYAEIITNRTDGYALSNEGFRGIGVKKDMEYNFSVLAKCPQQSHPKFKIQLVDSNEAVIGETTIDPSGDTWKPYKAIIRATHTEAKASLKLLFEGIGVVDIDLVSLFPSDTWKKRPNGMRADLVQLLADMKPGFMRFPGGCIVEGRELATRYQWKKTVGTVEKRKLSINRWNTEFTHRPAPDYFQSFGLGFFEYFQLSEDIGAEPLPILSCGMACQFNTGELAPIDELDPYIQDALDLIEFANGPVTSAWGKVRKEMGHEAPFNLKYIGVGNEQWGPQYIERYKVFSSAIKAKDPSIKIVSSAGPFPEGELFDYASSELAQLHTDIVDEHYYNKPEWFFKNSSRYDNYDRNGPKIFAGEYAAQSVGTVNPANKNNWDCALSEAAFMTGLERNADVVYMASYAPLFAHAEGWQWTPDLIWFDNLNSYGTPNYYVQKLFSNFKGTNLLSVLDNNENVSGQKGIYASAVLDKSSNKVIMKIVNNNATKQTGELKLDGKKKFKPTGKVITLSSDNGDDVNSFETPRFIAPKDNSLALKSNRMGFELQPKSFSVYVLDLQ